MNKPFFCEGEIVILQSKDAPEYNGEYEVHSVIGYKDEFTCRLTNEWTLENDEPGTFCYVFTTPLVDKVFGEGSECLWCESALRKKHQPSEMNFNELMSSLNIPITTW